VTSIWFFLSTLNYDARSTTHQICYDHSTRKMKSGLRHICEDFVHFHDRFTDHRAWIENRTERKLEVWLSSKRQQCACLFWTVLESQVQLAALYYWLFDTSDLQRWLHKILSWISLSTCQIYEGSNSVTGLMPRAWIYAAWYTCSIASTLLSCDLLRQNWTIHSVVKGKPHCQCNK